MAIRNTVSIEFSVSGPGMAQLDAIERRLRGLGSASGGLNTATANLGRLGTVGATAAAGVSRTTQAVHNLGTASTRTGGALRRIGEIVAGTFGGNVLAGIFTSAAAAAASFAKESVGAALSMEQALVVIKTQSRLTGTDLQANIELAKRLAKEFKVSETAGLGLAAGATRFASAAGRSGDTEAFLRSVADLAAAAGRPMSELNEIVRQIASGDVGAEAALDKILGGKNPSVVYDEFAKSIHRTADSLTTLEKKQALLNAVLVEGAKVQGVAAESMTGNTGRISTLSAAYDNLQTRLGTLIVQSTLFKASLDLLEKSVASLDKPETLAGFNTAFDRGRFIVETLGRGIAIVKAEAVLFGEQFSAIWDQVATSTSNFFARIGVDLRQLASDAVRTIIRFIDNIPPEVLNAIGIGAVSPETRASVIDTALNIEIEKQKLVREQAGQTGVTAARLAKAQADFNKAIGALPTIAPPGSGAPAATPGAANDAIAALGKALNAGAAVGVGLGVGDTSGDFRRVPFAIVNGDSITTGSRIERIAKEQVAASTDLGQKVAGLTAIMEETNKNPGWVARLEVVAGPDTRIKSVVPTGGVIP